MESKNTNQGIGKTKSKKRLEDIENRLVVTKGKREGGRNKLGV